MLYYGYKKDRVLKHPVDAVHAAKERQAKLVRMFTLKSNHLQSWQGEGGYFFLLMAIAMIATPAVKAEARNIPN